MYSCCNFPLRTIVLLSMASKALWPVLSSNEFWPIPHKTANTVSVLNKKFQPEIRKIVLFCLLLIQKNDNLIVHVSVKEKKCTKCHSGQK